MKYIFIRLVVWGVGLVMLVYIIPFIQVKSSQEVRCIKAPCNPITRLEKNITLAESWKPVVAMRSSWATREPRNTLNYPALIPYLALLFVLSEGAIFILKKKEVA